MKKIVMIIIFATVLISFVPNCFAVDTAKLKDGKIIIYDGKTGWKKKTLFITTPQDTEMKTHNSKIYLKTKSGLIRVYNFNGKLLKTYYKPNSGNWVKN